MENRYSEQQQWDDFTFSVQTLASYASLLHSSCLVYLRLTSGRPLSAVNTRAFVQRVKRTNVRLALSTGFGLGGGGNVSALSDLAGIWFVSCSETDKISGEVWNFASPLSSCEKEDLTRVREMLAGAGDGSVFVPETPCQTQEEEYRELTVLRSLLCVCVRVFVYVCMCGCVCVCMCICV